MDRPDDITEDTWEASKAARLIGADQTPILYQNMEIVRNPVPKCEDHRQPSSSIRIRMSASQVETAKCD